MIKLTVHNDYLSTDATDWLNDVSTPDETLTESFVAKVNKLGLLGEYATPEHVAAVFTAMGYTSMSGIYGEDDPAHVAMCNQETLLDDDLSFTFAHIDNGDYSRAVMIMTGAGYWLNRLESVEVRDFIGDDDADAFGFSRGYVSHDNREDCAEWILDEPNTLWPNGGGQTYRVSECILPDDEGEPRLVCPLCGDTLTAFVS